MKFFAVLALALGCAFFQTSCMTTNFLARAEGRPLPVDPPDAQFEPQPAYYLLVPVVFPLDVITFPFQFVYQQSNQ